MSAISVKNLNKKFILHLPPQTMFGFLSSMVFAGKYRREIWALRNIDFEAARGDRIGLIGGNGSGKTTLLRILARLYERTSGMLAVNGTVTAFLQSGAGMERELSAVENIYLFGAIMNMEREEITEKLPDIARFAGIGEFLDCPLKDFSAGMVQRLAFSIAYHADSDILLLDEMLSSGDAKIRGKSRAVFEKAVNQSKTIIITSHDMGIIREFCNKALLLEKGEKVMFGPTEKVLEAYKSL